MLKKIAKKIRRRLQKPAPQARLLDAGEIRTARGILEKTWEECPFNRWLQGDPDSPRNPYYVYIEVTNACNYQCVHCPQIMMERKVGFMKYERFTALIDKVKKHVKRIAIFKQGEPLLHPRIIDMCKYARDAGLVVDICSNASRLNEKIARGLVEAGVASFLTTLTADKESYERTHVKGKFETVIDNLKLLVNTRNKMGRKKPVVIAQIIRYPGHSEEAIEKFKTFCKRKIGVDEAQTLNLVYYSDHATHDTKAADFDPGSTGFNTCIYPWMLFGISWNGTAVPCVFDGDEKEKLGNVFDRGLMEVWRGDEMKNFRGRIAGGKFPKRSGDYPFLCSTCSILFDPAQQHTGRFAASFMDDGEFRETQKSLEATYEKELENRGLVYTLALSYLCEGKVVPAYRLFNRILAVSPFDDLADSVRQKLSLVLGGRIIYDAP